MIKWVQEFNLILIPLSTSNPSGELDQEWEEKVSVEECPLVGGAGWDLGQNRPPIPLTSTLLDQ